MKRAIPYISLAFFVLVGALMVINFTQSRTTTLSGPYLIAGMSRADDATWADMESQGLMEYGETPFNFVDEETVIINDRLAEIYFGDTLFNYEVKRNRFKLKNNDNSVEHDLEFDRDGGLFNVNLDHPLLKRIQLISASVPQQGQMTE